MWKKSNQEMIDLKLLFKWCKEEEKCEENWAIFRNAYLTNYVLIWFSSNLVCTVMYMESIKYINLIEIDLVVIEIWGVENSDLLIPINNTLVCRKFFLAADTCPCVLIYLIQATSSRSLIYSQWVIWVNVCNHNICSYVCMKMCW